jgi:hypothetical protein
VVTARVVKAARDAPRPGEGAERRVSTETGTVESSTAFCNNFLTDFDGSWTRSSPSASTT